jgi:hypothetical protein
MKINREWLEMLSEDEQVQFKNNMHRANYLESSSKSVNEFLKSAFHWSDSIEGFNHWFKIYEKYV